MASVEQLLCGNCDNPIEEHFNYCPNCGEKISKKRCCACNGSGYYDSVDRHGNSVKCCSCGGTGYEE